MTAWPSGRGAGALLAVSLGLVGWLISSNTAGMIAGGLLGMLTFTTRAYFVCSNREAMLLRWARADCKGELPPCGGTLDEVAARIGRTLDAHEQALDASRDELRQFLSAMDASPAGLILLDQADCIRWLNATAAQHLGIAADRDHGQRITNLVRAPAFVAHLQAGRVDEVLKLEQREGQGSLSIAVRPYGDSMKLMLTQDTTGRDRIDKMRRDFVANVSHEMRSPLTVLSGFVETMSTLPLTEVERTKVFSLMGQQTARMQRLVTDLLALAQIEGAPTPPADHWIEVTTLFKQLEADALALSAGKHRIHFACGEHAELSGSESELFSGMWNLVSNAMRYTPAGGSITVSFEVLRGGSAGFSVADNGIGIAADHIGRLTERFYRVDPSRSRETGGTGLGLAIVKHVIQRHGGELAVDSVVSRGSTFKLLFPAGRVRLAVLA